MQLDYTNSDALIGFIDQLRADGFNIGASHYVAVHELIVRLTARGVDLRSSDRLKTHLAPLFCSSPGEQEDFGRRFDHWIDEQLLAAMESKPPLNLRQKRANQRQRDLQERKQAFRRARFVFAGVSVLAIVATVIWLVYFSGAESVAGPVPEQPAPVEVNPRNGGEVVSDGDASSDTDSVTLPVQTTRKRPLPVQTASDEDFSILWIIVPMVTLLIALFVALIWKLKARYAMDEVLSAAEPI